MAYLHRQACGDCVSLHTLHPRTASPSPFVPSRYHYHMDLVCDYNLTAAGHSTLVGVMLDGRGLYGRYETFGAIPMDLDMCGGHVGE